MKQTALFPFHKELGAKIVEFAGWGMPVQYKSLRAEHLAVREKAGLFDVGHMGEIEIRGKDTLSFCQYLTSNDILKVSDNQAQYTLICNHKGGVVDDVIVYKFSDEHIFICANASNASKVYSWVADLSAGYDVEITDSSSEYSQIAIQGPSAEEILSASLGVKLNSIKRFRFETINWNNYDLIVARTGYTGENGYEVFLPWDKAGDLWSKVLDIGQGYNIMPCGLGARDTLRIEMGYSLYGHEITEEINPLAAGLGGYVSMDGDDFLGKAAIQGELDKGLKIKINGFEMIDRGIPRQGYNIYKDGELVGYVTSGTMSPSLEKPIGIGYLKSGIEYGNKIQIDIRNTKREAVLKELPFYKKDNN